MVTAPLFTAGQTGSTVRRRQAGVEAVASRESILSDSGKHGFASRFTFYRELREKSLDLSELQCLLI